MAHIIMGHRAPTAFLQRQARLRPIQGLDLALLIQDKHDRVLGRIDVEPTTSSFSAKADQSRP